LRVIGGDLKRSKLFGPEDGDDSIRVTYDRVRESIFNLTGPMDGVRFLDLFAGAGSVGIEALSRGAAKVAFVDHAPKAIRLVESNVGKFGLEDRVEIIRMDVREYVAGGAARGVFDLIFLDPPYAGGLFEVVMDSPGIADMLADGGKVVGQHGAEPERVEFGALLKADVRRYGSSWVSIWKKNKDSEK